MNKTVRILAIGLSFATLIFLLPIKSALFPSVGLRSWAVDISRDEVSAALLLVIISALLFAVLFVLSRRIRDRRANMEVRLLFVLIQCAAFGSLSFELVNWFYITDRSIVYFILPATVLALTALVSQRSGFSAAAWEDAVGSTLLFLAPAAMLLNIQLATHLFTAEEITPPNVDQPKATEVVEPDGPKVVWIIFDEMDYAAFTHRPAGIRTPAFDRLMANSFVATNAYPPAQRTRESIPSLLYGRIISEYEPSILESWSAFGGRAEKDYFRTDETSLIHDVNQMNKRAGVLGWYIPFERLFGDEHTFGEWKWFRTERCKSIGNCAGQFLDQAYHGSPIRNPFGAPANPSDSWEKWTADQRQRNRYMMAQVNELIADKSYALKLFHLSVPHGPYSGTEKTKGRPTYFDNLELADENLSNILSTLHELYGEATTLIITSDHWWRDKIPNDFAHLSASERDAAFSDLRVPFIVQIGGNNKLVQFDVPFNTVAIRKLINAILSGKVRSNTDVAQFLSAYAEQFPGEASFRPRRTQLPKVH